MCTVSRVCTVEKRNMWIPLSVDQDLESSSPDWCTYQWDLPFVGEMTGDSKLNQINENKDVKMFS